MLYRFVKFAVTIPFLALAASCVESEASSTNADGPEGASACSDGDVRCDGFNLGTCLGGIWHWTSCRTDCESYGLELYGCLDYDRNGVDECTCRYPDPGSGGSGGSAGEGGSGGGTPPPPTANLGYEFIPTNFPASVVETLTPDDDFHTYEDCRLKLNTSTGKASCGTYYQESELTSFNVFFASQIDGPDLTVFVVRDLNILAGTGLEMVGQRPAVFLASGDINIDGYLDAAADIDIPGPGGGTTGGYGPGMDGIGQWDAAGGGGAFCMPGGKGAPPTGGFGGEPYGNPELAPLFPGSPGGTAAGATSSYHAGAGGGAVQLVAGGVLRVGPSGVINVGGGGGNFSYGLYGHGGGSGGAILLEAPVVEVQGTLAANGGSGSCDDAGSNAKTSTSPASSACGGRGGAGTTGAGNGIKSSLDSGGGGGGVGRIRVNSQAAQGAFLAGSIVSPDPSMSCTSQGPLRTEPSASAAGS